MKSSLGTLEQEVIDKLNNTMPESHPRVVALNTNNQAELVGLVIKIAAINSCSIQAAINIIETND